MEFTHKLRKALDTVPTDLIPKWMTELWLEEQIQIILGSRASYRDILSAAWDIILSNIETPQEA